MSEMCMVCSAYGAKNILAILCLDSVHNEHSIVSHVCVLCVCVCLFVIVVVVVAFTVQYILSSTSFDFLWGHFYLSNDGNVLACCLRVSIEKKKTKSHRLFPKRTHYPNEQSFNIALRMNQQIGFDCVDKITSKQNEKKNRLSSPCTYLS